MGFTKQDKYFFSIKIYIEKTTADTENRTQVSDLQDQCNDHYTIPAYFNKVRVFKSVKKTRFSI